MFTSAERTRFQRRLLAWFRNQRRDLPWRRSRDPYAIWVSEVMLQQTQVTTVIPFFLRFMERFPTVAALAGASEQDVLRLWEGLGYYRRARHLHRAAQVIVAEHGCRFPDEVEAAAALPGLGRYTVGAVLSQAFDRRLPVVDANVARVLCRLGAWTGVLEERATQTWLWQTAEALLPRRDVGDFNQALMELGQTVCVPGQPACLLCPLREQCRGRAQGLAETLPRRRAKAPTLEGHEAAVVIEREDRVLIGQRRPEAARWANMWEVPMGAIEASPRSTHINRLVKQLTGAVISKPRYFGSLQYGVTRFRLTLLAFTAGFQGGTLKHEQYQDWQWVREEDLPNYPLSVPQRRLVKLWKATSNT